ncbi:MAG: hypothetical protein LUD17_08990 [Bacteroidales bacterium]|nr:hypothetical protein [Bacteroidales bacterium]
MDYESIKKKYDALMKARQRKITLAKAKVETMEALSQQRHNERAQLLSERDKYTVPEFAAKFREIGMEEARTKKQLEEAQRELNELSVVSYLKPYQK